MSNTITQKRQAKTLEKINSEPLTWEFSDQSHFLSCMVCRSRRPTHKNIYELDGGIRILLLVCESCSQIQSVTFE